MNTEESKTPLCDALADSDDCWNHGKWSSLARKLEAQLSAAETLLRSAEQVIGDNVFEYEGENWLNYYTLYLEENNS